MIGDFKTHKNFFYGWKENCCRGNIYATEALFRAGIRPTLPCMKLSAARCSQLVACLKSVLVKAISKGGSSLRDFSGYRVREEHLLMNT